MKIPKDHHRFILGQKGQKLATLELASATKISIPGPKENSDIITIIGSKEGIERARHEIQCTSDEQVGTIPVLCCMSNNLSLKPKMEERGK